METFYLKLDDHVPTRHLFIKLFCLQCTKGGGGYGVIKQAIKDAYISTF